mmetsp:Transcript_121103/g.302211  ORF Transcript_121103/g.302211 Transcript_121103/m.302211 type:complete len:285 (+) Transcript_121103:482-1336(+)
MRVQVLQQALPEHAMRHRLYNTLVCQFMLDAADEGVANLQALWQRRRRRAEAAGTASCGARCGCATATTRGASGSAGAALPFHGQADSVCNRSSGQTQRGEWELEDPGSLGVAGCLHCTHADLEDVQSTICSQSEALALEVQVSFREFPRLLPLSGRQPRKPEAVLRGVCEECVDRNLDVETALLAVRRRRHNTAANGLGTGAGLLDRGLLLLSPRVLAYGNATYRRSYNRRKNSRAEFHQAKPAVSGLTHVLANKILGVLLYQLLGLFPLAVRQPRHLPSDAT